MGTSFCNISYAAAPVGAAASTLDAPVGNININAQKVDIREAKGSRLDMTFLKPPHHPYRPQHERRWQSRKCKQSPNIHLAKGRRSTLTAGRDIKLQADNNIHLLAAQSTADQKSTNSSSSASVGISIGTAGFGVTVSASGARGKADGNDVTQTNTQVVARNQIRLTSGQDTTLKGAVASAEQVTAKVGRNLNIESLQDTSQFASKQQSLGGSVTLGASAGGSFSASKSRINSNFASVAQQSGIRAGDGGFDVEVTGNTDLKGGAITSTQTAIDQKKNNFKTAKLTTGDIQNKASFKAKALGISAGASANNLGGALKPSGTSIGIGQDSGNASSTTQAAISGIAGNTAARTGDKETGIQKIFDAEKVQKEINAQVLITQTFGREAPRAAADFAVSRGKDLLEQAKSADKSGDTKSAEALRAEAQQWGEGGAYRIALQAAVGGLAGGVSGALGAGASAAAVPLLNQLQSSIVSTLKNAGASDTVAQLAGQAVSLGAAAGIGAAAGGGNVAGVASGLNVDANNRQLHPTEVSFLQDKTRVKRYVQYLKESTGQVLTEEQASKNLDRFGAASADEQFAKINGRDKTTETFILKEAIASGQFYRDKDGNPHPLFNVTLAEFKNETLNLKPLFDAYAKGDPNVKAFLNNNFDPARLTDFAERFRAGQELGKRDADKNANPITDAGTIVSSIVKLPGYIYDSVTSNEVGPIDSERLKAYYQTLLKLQGRAEEAGYLSEFDFATAQRLAVVGLPLAELGGVLVGKTPALAKAAAAKIDALAETAARDALLKSGGVVDRATGQSILDLKQLTTAQKATAGELFGENTVRQIVPDGQKIARVPGVGETGIDDLYKVNRKDVDYVVIEYKFDTSRQGVTKDGLQGSDSWLRGDVTNYNRILESVSGNERIADTVVKSLENGRVEKWLVRTLPDGSTEIKILDAVGKPKPTDTSKILLPGKTINGARP